MKKMSSVVSAAMALLITAAPSFACGDDEKCDGSHCKGKDGAKHSGHHKKDKQEVKESKGTDAGSAGDTKPADPGQAPAPTK